MTDVPPPDLLAAFSERLATLAAAGAARTLSVHARDGRSRSAILWEEGLLVTAEEALETDEGLFLTLPDGRRVAATLAGRDPGTDTALLRAEAGPAAPLPLAPPEALAAGHVLLALGRGEHGPVVAVGHAAVVGGPWRSTRGGRLARRLEIATRLPRESEGGPVLDHAGRLVGMAVPGPRRRVLAIPAETIARTVELLKARGRVARSYVGVALQPIGLPEGRRGLIVVGLDRDGPAMRAGLMLGDILLAWNGTPLVSVRDMLAWLDPKNVGRQAALDVVRAGVKLRVTLRIGERAAP